MQILSGKSLEILSADILHQVQLKTPACHYVAMIDKQHMFTGDRLDTSSAAAGPASLMMFIDRRRARPERAAKWRAEEPSSVQESTLQPCASRNATRARLPASHAVCQGVTPMSSGSCSRQPVCINLSTTPSTPPACRRFSSNKLHYKSVTGSRSARDCWKNDTDHDCNVSIPVDICVEISCNQLLQEHLVKSGMLTVLSATKDTVRAQIHALEDGWKEQMRTSGSIV